MHKITKFDLIVLFIFLIKISSFLSAQEESFGSKFLTRIWLELQGSANYDYNNFYIKQYSNYSILQLNTKLGLQALNLQKGLLAEPYFRYSHICDPLGENWNKVDWHNNYVIGYGCQLRYSLKAIKLIDDKIGPETFDIKLFAEKLSIAYPGKKEIEFRPEKDFKIGIQYWLEIGFRKKSDNADRLPNTIWIESAGSYIYSKSDFYIQSNENFYLLSFDMFLQSVFL